MDKKALYNLSYGVFMLATRSGNVVNGCITNTCIQVANNPVRIAISVLNSNYTCDLIKESGIFTLSLLDQTCSFETIRHFGFQSGRTADKFAGQKVNRSGNGLVFLDKYINAFMSLKVEQYVDLGTHGMFICSVTEARVMSDQETMTYTYYQNNVKPKPETEGKKGFVCKVCGYVYEGDELPEDIICPLCKHGAVDFEPIQ